jgi:hypothetical protein
MNNKYLHVHKSRRVLPKRNFFLKETGYRSQTYRYNQTKVSVAINSCMVSKGVEEENFVTAVKRSKWHMTKTGYYSRCLK